MAWGFLRKNKRFSSTVTLSLTLGLLYRKINNNATGKRFALDSRPEVGLSAFAIDRMEVSPNPRKDWVL